jgi:hypothetical protein
MSLVEIFLNLGVSLYEGEFANYSRHVFEYESMLSGEAAAEEAYKIINSASFELNDVQSEIQSEYLVNNEDPLLCGDVVIVSGVAYVCLQDGWKIL